MVDGHLSMWVESQRRLRGSSSISDAGRNHGNSETCAATGVVSEKDYQARLATYSSSMSPTRDPETDEIVQALVLQAYHLPGNSWTQDWIQYMTNNHPIFGIFCRNTLHPIGTCTRVVALLGTIIFGLALTNLFYLFYLWNPQFNTVLATFVTNSGNVWTLSTGMLLFWTLGGSVHCAFNLAIWHIAACACCRSGGFCESRACCPSLGKHMMRVIVLCIVAMCALIVLLRVAITNHENENDADGLETEADGDYDSSTTAAGVNIQLDDTLNLEVHNAAEFQFLVAYLVESVLAMFIYYPIGGTVLFSGILGCGFKIPLLGGRPYEVAAEERRKARQQRQESSRAIPTGSMSSTVTS
jgi:hypothetical protein